MTKKFKVTIGRDATVYYQATVDAESIEEVKSNVSKYGYDCPFGTVWEQIDVSPFENVEVAIIEGDGQHITKDGESNTWEYVNDG